MTMRICIVVVKQKEDMYSLGGGEGGEKGTLCKTYTYSRWLLNRLDLQYLENFKMKKQDLNES